MFHRTIKTSQIQFGHSFLTNNKLDKLIFFLISQFSLKTKLFLDKMKKKRKVNYSPIFEKVIRKRNQIPFCCYFHFSSITNFSNEIFYEIFDYLDGYDIYRSFSKLNQRFENLLHSQSYLMKIQIDSSSVFDSDYQKFIQMHENILNQFISSRIVDLTYNCLESIVLDRISTYKFVILLFYFKTLPNLFSLKVKFDHFENNFSDIYQMIYRFRSLKYLQIRIDTLNEFFFSNLSINDQMYSSIEYLVISYPCDLNNLFNLIS